MKDELFEELVESIREGGKILRGEKPAARTFAFDPSEIQKMREQFRLSQSEFAAMMGISRNTLQNWEQGRRSPQGPARILLQVAAKHPEAVWDVVQPGKNRPKDRNRSRKTSA